MIRQVPLKYTIIGDGKVAKHFAHYFHLLDIEFNCWSRRQFQLQSCKPSLLEKQFTLHQTYYPQHQSRLTLQKTIEASDVVLLLISDDAIEDFIESNAFLKEKQLLHFSGSLTSKYAISCHPLMTFAHQLYELEQYEKIPFVIDDGYELSDLFPKFKNEYVTIKAKDKAYYHSLCVMAGNFAQILWQAIGKEFEQNLNLPKEILNPYLLQNTQNFVNNPETSATGPLQRGDFATIKKHLNSLQNNPLLEIYQAFLNHQKPATKIQRVQ
jgi:predicted short-subunit dehydrogenase-like oxidoreductase (DUF2520 family)